MRRCFVLPVVLGLSLGSLGAVVDNRDSIPFRVRDTSDVVVPVGVAGRGPFRFLLDTGSNRTALTDRLAKELRLPAAGQTTVVTAAGRTSRPLVQATLELGSARSIVNAMILPAADLGQGIDGLLGSDFLASRRFTIDYRHRRMMPEHDDRSGPGATVALTHDANGFLVTLPARDGTLPLRLIPDTGTASVVLFARPGHPLPRFSPMDAVPLRTVGRVKVGRAVLLEQLWIGRVEVRDQLAIVMEGSSVDSRLGDGLLPLHLFARVTFDGARGALTVTPYR